jgi:diaminohydroxyphosphoribosylaminopyrimidine deaminase/5-amino-6-(5-phosphoribosylamino)uracil reductase
MERQGLQSKELKIAVNEDLSYSIDALQSKEILRLMRRCFELASRGAGYVSPNPLVGAVITKNDKVISDGWHEKFGSAHAEANAIAHAEENLENATLYCNLEPCVHTDKNTPPCVPAIIESGIKKVVISNIDPNPKVAGEGVVQLQSKGIKVETSILEREGRELNRFYFKYITKKLPYISLKIAQSVDRKITKEAGKQTWLTGKESGEFVHKLRSIYDAVLVGCNTINVDNPRLNVKNVKGRNPKRIIIDGGFNLNLDAACLNDNDSANTWIFISDDIKSEKLDLLYNKGIKIFQSSLNENRRIDLNFVLRKLYEENISSVLVEGGRDIFSQFIERDLFDELILLQAPVIIGKGIDAFNNFNEIPLELFSFERLGEDLKFVYRRKYEI